MLKKLAVTLAIAPVTTGTQTLSAQQPSQPLSSRSTTAAPGLAVVLALTVVLIHSAQAQTLTVLHNFTGGQDGAYPYAGLTMAGGGNLYGTAASGSSPNCPAPGCGVVFRLTHKGSGWAFNPLYSFAGGNDGFNPTARVIIGANGSLYGPTPEGGGGGCTYFYGVGCGTVFMLTPSPTACKTALCPWEEAVLYRFPGGSNGGSEGDRPAFGDLIFDGSGNLYGTTIVGGLLADCNHGGCGVVYELTPVNGGWAEDVLYPFTGGPDGGYPYDGVIFDQAGNLYGTTYYGGTPGCYEGNGCGTVFQLAPSGSGWTEKVLYTFQNGSDGASPVGGLIFDQSGNLYGTTALGGSGKGGTVFELTPGNGGWTLNTLYSFGGSTGSYASLTMDATGNLYGTTFGDGMYGYGNVFKLSPSNGGWTYTSLHDFTGGIGGANPVGGVLIDANGNLYGTASAGGAYGYGVVWEITP